jgi:hypothetical protein
MKIFELYDRHLLAWKEFEDALELSSIKSALDISKTARFSRRRSGYARLFFSYGVEEIQRLATSVSLHVPVSKSAVNRVPQKDQQLDFWIVIPNPLHHRLVIEITGRAITGDG